MNYTMFLSKRPNVNFDGCAFYNYLYFAKTPKKVETLRKSFWYGKDFIELTKSEDDKKLMALSQKSPNQLTKEDLEYLMNRKKPIIDVESKVIEDFDGKPRNELYKIAKEKGWKIKYFNSTKIELIKFLKE